MKRRLDALRRDLAAQIRQNRLEDKKINDALAEFKRLGCK
jgi:hypothetical protein